MIRKTLPHALNIPFMSSDIIGKDFNRRKQSDKDFLSYRENDEMSADAA